MKNNIAYLRKNKGYNQAEFAKKLGISRTILSFIENDRKKPNIDELNKIAFELGVTPKDLFSNKDDKIIELISTLTNLTDNDLISWEKISDSSVLSDIKKNTVDNNFIGTFNENSLLTGFYSVSDLDTKYFFVIKKEKNNISNDIYNLSDNFYLLFFDSSNNFYNIIAHNQQIYGLDLSILKSSILNVSGDEIINQLTEAQKLLKKSKD